jgi:pimeloyl-ACP methyl ester carboxylesterase
MIVRHEPSPENAYAWFSYVPKGLPQNETTYILLTAIDGTTYDYGKSARITKEMLEERLRWPHIEQFVLLAPVIPRRESPHVYPVAFDLVSFRETDQFYSRADIKVNQMIDELIGLLKADGYQVSDRVMIEGFSSGGMFAQRYALLHSERVKAISAGHCGGNFTLPLDEYEGQPLRWPVGVNNINELAGLSFNRKDYMRIAQHIYIGDLDTGEGNTTIVYNRLHPDWGPGYHWESIDQMEFLHSTFGNTDPVRLGNQVRLLQEFGYNQIEFRLYGGTPHQLTPAMMNDLMTFLSDQTRD